MLTNLPWLKRNVAFCALLAAATGTPFMSVAQGKKKAPQTAQRQLEKLGRGIVAVQQADGKVFVSWRLLATDNAKVGFNLFRQPVGGEAVKLNAKPLTESTNWVDETPDATPGTTYFVRAVRNGGPGHGEESSNPEKATVWGEGFLRVPLKRPAGGTAGLGLPGASNYTYNANDASVADLDGDGQYEIVLKWDPSNSRDNASAGLSGTTILDAYKMDGTFLWRIDLGKNIRSGAHYTQFMVYDLDGDGKAEVACKTADGTVDGVGTVIGDPTKDYRSLTVASDGIRVAATNDSRFGKVLAGPEFFTVFDGLTGVALATTDYIPSRDPSGAWGGVGGNGGNDNTGNRVDRFTAAVAYLDGQRPSVVMARGYYGRSVLAAWDWRDGKLTSRWVFDSKDRSNPYSGMGNHGLSVNDVDFDGKDEIVYGAMVVDDNGQGLFTTGLRHGDALHVSNFDPTTPNQEAWGIHENEVDVPGYTNGPGVALYDARTGQVLWGADYGVDAGRGMAADIDPRHLGAEVWGGSRDVGLRTIKGERIGTAPSSTNFGIWWDGDLLRELLDGTAIDKWNHLTSTSTRILQGTTIGAASNNGSKANPSLTADLVGDWREEVIWRNSNNQELLIVTTTIPTTHRIVTLMQDPQYRMAIAWQNVGYNQPPHTSYYLGEGMDMASVSPLGPEKAATTATVYPNPTTSSFRIDAPSDFTYEVYNNFGQVVEQGAGEPAKSIGAGLKAGLYTVKVHSTDGVQTIQVSKE